jgi:hypothetical protein
VYYFKSRRDLQQALHDTMNQVTTGKHDDHKL